MKFEITRVVKDANYARMELISRLETDILDLMADLDFADGDRERQVVNDKIQFKKGLLDKLSANI